MCIHDQADAVGAGVCLQTQVRAASGVVAGLTRLEPGSHRSSTDRWRSSASLLRPAKRLLAIQMLAPCHEPDLELSKCFTGKPSLASLVIVCRAAALQPALSRASAGSCAAACRLRARRFSRPQPSKPMLQQWMTIGNTASQTTPVPQLPARHCSTGNCLRDALLNVAALW